MGAGKNLPWRDRRHPQVRNRLPESPDRGIRHLKSRKDGATLLTLGGGSVTFNFNDLRRRQIGEIRLVEPVINASPRFPEAFSAPPGSEGESGCIPWGVRRLVCDYGELSVADYGPPGLTIQAKFCFDLKDFSPAAAPARSPMNCPLGPYGGRRT